MAFEIDDILKEINKFKTNVSSSSDLVSKIEDAVNSVKSSTKETVTNIDEQIKFTKNAIGELEDSTKKSIISAKDLLVETKDRFASAASDIIQKCETIVNNSKETAQRISKSIDDIDGTITKMETKIKKEKKLITASIIFISLVSITTLIISIISLVK